VNESRDRPAPAAEAETRLFDGRCIVLRPIRPEDEAAHRAFLESLRPEDVHFRFFGLLRRFDHAQLVRYTHLDQAREIAFIAAETAGERRTLGVARAAWDAGRRRAEFAIVVRPDSQGQGLGRLLLEKLLAHCRAAGIGELCGQVLAGNARMLSLARDLGFEIAAAEDGVRTVRLALD
jgi:acetyltransferase